MPENLMGVIGRAPKIFLRSQSTETISPPALIDAMRFTVVK
jgi:hypothetical protein